MKRCAIYTRKSTEEGLEQDFNSLDAQREASEAFIKSQTHEGWRVSNGRYDDGGYSGGTMDRPALQKLLADIETGRIDIVVVYKVDRLTRSLADFAKIVELFDKKNVSFVSVTQAFNTTTSMGRLTLNVLLSFAQFEREVTAERIRDKISASKKKGMWMGGPPPIGYDAIDKLLVVNEDEAETVRTLFALYRERGTVRCALEEANRRGIVTKRRTTKAGRRTGGLRFSRGNLYQLLSNPLYAGLVPHRGETYPGQHTAIIDPDVWQSVQDQLSCNAAPRQSTTNTKSQLLLTGLVFDETGDRLSPTHAVKTKGKRYRYYISSRLMHDADKYDDGWRIRVEELDTTVRDSVVALLADHVWLNENLAGEKLSAAATSRMIEGAKKVAGTLKSRDKSAVRKIVREIVSRIDLAADKIMITLDRDAMRTELGISAQATSSEQQNIMQMDIPVRFRRRGVETKLVIGGQTQEIPEPDQKLCRLIAQAHQWMAMLTSGSVTSVRQIAQKVGIDEGDVSRFLPLAFLSPSIVEAIIAGRQPVELTANALKRIGLLPVDWVEQEKLLNIEN